MVSSRQSSITKSAFWGHFKAESDKKPGKKEPAVSMTQTEANEGVRVSPWEQKAGRGGGTAAMLAGCENEPLKQVAKKNKIPSYIAKFETSSISKHKAYDFFFIS